jgi:hypothetical protein
MAERRLGAPKLSEKPAPEVAAPKLRGRLRSYVPRGAQYDYTPPSVFARYKILTTVFAILLVALFGYWALVLRQTRAASQPAQRVQRQAQPAQQTQPAQPQSDPVYIEPLAPK